MGRRHSLAQKSIQCLCEIYDLDEQMLYEKAKLLLKIYRNVCWAAGDRAAMRQKESEESYEKELSEGLGYLNAFTPAEEREKFEQTVQGLVRTNWLIELVDTAMLKMRDFPYTPELYFDIIFKCYLSRFCYTEPEILEVLGLERSTYYDKKKEAIKIFGLALWGNAIPQWKQVLTQSTIEEDGQLPG